jgi:hypothetical protein
MPGSIEQDMSIFNATTDSADSTKNFQHHRSTACQIVAEEVGEEGGYHCQKERENKGCSSKKEED